MSGRRTFLAITASAVAARTVLPTVGETAKLHGAVKLPSPDAELLRLEPLLVAAMHREAAAWPAAEAEFDDEGPDTLKAHRLNGETAAIIDQIERFTAVTPAGVLVKVRALRWCRGNDPLDLGDVGISEDVFVATDARLLLAIGNDLLAMVGGVA